MAKPTGSAVSATVAQLARNVAAGAPRGWKRAKLRGRVTDSVDIPLHDVRFEPDDLTVLYDYGTSYQATLDSMRRLYTLLEADDHVMVELTVTPRGRYRAVVSQRLGRTDSGGMEFRYVLDPAPGSAEPAAGTGGSEAGDPHEAVMLLREFQRRLTEILGEGSKLDLPPPLPESVRVRLASGLGVPLPRDLLALYAIADGYGGGEPFTGCRWLGLAELVELAKLGGGKHRLLRRGWRRYVDVPDVKDFGPPLTIRRLSDHPAWIPFATGVNHDQLAVDLAPGPNGRRGQVILIRRYHRDGAVYVADSVTTLLRRQVEALRRGLFEFDCEGDLLIHAGDWEEHRRAYAERHTLEVVGPDAAPVRGIRPELRELTVSNAPWVDLEPVRRASAIWRFTAQNCPGTDLSPLRDIPVEVVDLETSSVDLAGLAGHPTLRHVVLRTENPADLRPLLSCPRLSALDLSEAPEADISVLPGLAALRWLRMRRPQWESAAVPERLAVAELTEEPLEERKLFWSFDHFYKRARPTLRDAIVWATRLAVPGDAGIWTFSGRCRS